MVEHVGICYESIGLHSLNLDTEDSTGDHHSDLGVFFDRELYVLRNFLTYQVVVRFNVFNFFMNLIKERTSLQPLLIFLCEEYWEIVKVLRKNVYVCVPF
jgi:hypothetical protein